MSSSGVWKQRSGARCGTAGFLEQMLPYRSAPRTASTKGCVYGWQVAGGKNGQRLQNENKRSSRRSGWKFTCCGWKTRESRPTPELQNAPNFYAAGLEGKLTHSRMFRVWVCQHWVLKLATYSHNNAEKASYFCLMPNEFWWKKCISIHLIYLIYSSFKSFDHR